MKINLTTIIIFGAILNITINIISYFRGIPSSYFDVFCGWGLVLFIAFVILEK